MNKFINNGIYRKTLENVRKHKDIKLVITEERRNYLVSEPNYHTQFFFFWKPISNRNEKNKDTYK